MLRQEQLSTTLEPLGKSIPNSRVFREQPAPIAAASGSYLMTFTERFESLLMGVHTHRGLILRISMALVFVWFGGLKIFGVSPAFGLVEQTVFWFPAETFVPLLGLAEVLIGLGLAYGRHMRWVLMILAGHMLATFSPLVIIPDVCFQSFPFELTLEGQYIVKNLVFVAVGMVLAAGIWARQKNSSLVSI